MSELRVWIDQSLCTGDGLCVQMAPEIFEFDVDGLAYVKGPDGELQSAAGATVAVPFLSNDGVVGAADDCPGTCIHVADATGRKVAGPGS